MVVLMSVDPKCLQEFLVEPQYHLLQLQKGRIGLQSTNAEHYGYKWTSVTLK